jgi:hypothetical protein
LVKSRHSGENRSPEKLQLVERTRFRHLPRKRSGVRRNDEKAYFLTLYNIILFHSPKDSNLETFYPKIVDQLKNKNIRNLFATEGTEATEGSGPKTKGQIQTSADPAFGGHRSETAIDFLLG